MNILERRYEDPYGIILKALENGKAVEVFATRIYMPDKVSRVRFIENGKCIWAPFIRGNMEDDFQDSCFMWQESKRMRECGLSVWVLKRNPKPEWIVEQMQSYDYRVGVEIFHINVLE